MVGEQVQRYSFFNLRARLGQVVKATSRPLYPREGDSVPTILVQETVWVTGPIWTVSENFSLMGTRFPGPSGR
jgi:hypothetical protein